MSQPPKDKVTVRSVPTERRPAANIPPPRSSGRPVNTRAGAPPPPRSAPRRDAFPFVIGGVVGALVVGLMLVAFLLTNRGNNGGTTTGSNGGANPGPTSAAIAPVQSAVVADLSPTVQPAPRMEMAAFKKLYDDPAKRPLIIDVRAKASYDAGHIRGSESFPESDVDTRIGELQALPKDKLIVAYCQ